MPASWQLRSPGGALSMTIEQAGSLSYRVERHDAGQNTVLIEPSSLGLRTDYGQFADSLQFVRAGKPKTVKETFTAPTGKSSVVQNHYTEQTLIFRNPQKQQLQLIIRAYDGGVAFRYRISGKKGERAKLLEEKTGFRLPLEGRAWIQPYDTVTKWTPGYEQPYQSDIHIGQASPRAEGWCFPALFEARGHWILLTEAGLDGSYTGAHLQPQSPGGLYTLRFPETAEAMGAGNSLPAAELPWATPWRVIIAGKDLGDIIESDLVKCLAPPPPSPTPGWVKPGRVSWSWWSDHDSPQHPERLRPFIALAAEMGWEYSLIDANWNRFPEDSLHALIRYADSLGVGLWLWYNSGGPHNEVEEQPRDLMHERTVRRREFQKLRDWGIKGVKIDFFQSDKQHIIQQYIEIMEDAAEFQILLNFHGCTLPRGWERSYPHLLTMEAVRGAETYSFNAGFPRQAPRHNTILPATRNVVGPMDYTPVTFSHHNNPRLTTAAHELALSVLFESGAIHLADRVESYRSLPDEVKAFLREVPANWDETKYLYGRPGQEMVIARRKGSTWYVAGINGEEEEKSIALDLSFMPKGLHTRFCDGPEPGAFDIQRNAGDAVEKSSISMQPFGGFVIVIQAENEK